MTKEVAHVGVPCNELLDSLHHGDMRFGLSAWTANALFRYWPKTGISGPSFFGLWQQGLRNPSWKESVASVRGIGERSLSEIEQLFTYFNWVDANFPQGFPAGIFHLRFAGDGELRLAVGNVDYGRCPLMAPSIRRSIATMRKVCVMGGGEVGFAIREMDQLERFYGIKIPVAERRSASQEDAKPNWLTDRLEVGRSLLAKLAPRQLDLLKIRDLVTRTGLFSLVKQHSVGLSLEALDNFLALVSGVAITTAGERDLQIFADYYFSPAGIGVTRADLREISGNGLITRQRVCQILARIERYIRESLDGMPYEETLQLFPSSASSNIMIGGRQLPVTYILEHYDMARRYAQLMLEEGGRINPVVKAGKPVEQRSRTWFQTHHWPTLSRVLGKGFAPRGIPGQFLDMLGQAGVNIYITAGSEGRYYYVDPKDANMVLEIWQGFSG